MFAHNASLIRLNQNALICISTQDYFNLTCSYKHSPNFPWSLDFCYFFFKAETGPVAYANLKEFESIVQMCSPRPQTAVNFRV